MSVKKILLLGAAGVAAVSMTSAMAGGYTPEPAAVADNGYYIEGALGYARQNYFDNAKWRNFTGVESNSSGHNQGGFAGGVDLGYKINKNYAVELGWFDLPSVNVNTSNTGNAAYMSSWALYLAAKYMMPLTMMSDTNWFFKLGVAYREVNMPSNAVISGTTGTTPIVTANGVQSNQSDYVRPMFGTGFDYAFTPNLDGVVEYTYFMGASNSFGLNASTNVGALGTVAANVFTLGLAYNFNV